MNLIWKYDQENIDWDELSELYKIAPLGEKNPKELELVFGNSKFKCFALHENEIVAVGRALADGADCSYLCDVAVHPSFQGLGLGKAVVQKLVEFSRDHKKIILYANPGKEPFYKKLGFSPMNTAMAIFKNHDVAVEKGLISNS
ncbi:MAG: GNAT family N-acetyltransferase [Smithella sp.]